MRLGRLVPGSPSSPRTAATPRRRPPSTTGCDLHGYAYALKESARAGHSEHQLGTSLDFRSYGGPAPWDVTDWATTKAGKWMKANAWKYGFIMSYPKGKTSVTCYMYEPWHYRYVGRDRAIWVRDSGKTLREFIWAEQTRPHDTLSPAGTTRP